MCSPELPGVGLHKAWDRRGSKSSGINFNLTTSRKSTDLGGSSLTSNTHKETLPWWQAPPCVRAREEEGGGNGCILQRMLCTASSRDSVTSLPPQWQLRPLCMKPMRFTKGSLLSHQLSAGLLGEIPWSAQVSSSRCYDGGAGSTASACHLHYDTGSCLTT